MSGTVSQGILNDRIWPLILPAAAVFLALGVGPLLWMFVISFWRVDVFRIAPDLTLRNYIDAVSLHGRALASTMALGIAVAAICTVLSIAVATVIRFAKPRTGQILLFLVLVTLFGGYLTKIYAWKTILGNDGVINSGLLTAGIISTPIEQLLYSPAAVIAAMVGFLLPFAVLPVAGALRAVEMIEIEACVRQNRNRNGAQPMPTNRKDRRIKTWILDRHRIACGRGITNSSRTLQAVDSGSPDQAPRAAQRTRCFHACTG